MEGLRSDSAFARLAADWLGDDGLRLVDVGCVGGFAAGWKVLGDRLNALGVTLSAAEAQALAEAEPSPGIRFAHQDLRLDHAAWSTSPRDRLSRHRSMVMRAVREAGQSPVGIDDWVRQRANDIQTPLDKVRPAPFDGLRQYIQEAGFAEPHFLRIDAGDVDYEVLRSLEPLLGPELLGVALRPAFFGSDNINDHSFHNMDRLLRAKGFDLFTLNPITYSAAALPAPYLDAHPAQTISGRILYATAIYLRDLGRNGATPATPAPLPTVLRAATLAAMLSLPDVAADILLLNKPALEAAGFSVESGLDLLARQSQEPIGGDLAYRDYMAAFEAEAPYFFNVYARQAAWMAELMDGPRRERRLEDLARSAIRETLQWRLEAARSAGADPAARVQWVRQDADRRGKIWPDSHWTFEVFEPYLGPQTAEFYLDYLGTRTRPAFVDWGTPAADERHAASVPPLSEESFEWADILQAVAESGPSFTMLELGAGYGRWTSRGVVAARQLGKSVRVGLAEAEPRHQTWLRQHMEDNGIAPSEFTLFPAAIGGAAGKMTFAIKPPPDEENENWFGQAVVPDSLDGAEVIDDYFGAPLLLASTGWGCIIVDQIPLSDVLAHYDFVDIADFDLQGAEAEAIGEAIGPLTAKVRRLHIGTHGHDIEARLREILTAAGWICLRDFPCHQHNDTPFGPCDFVDGVQTWVNPPLL